MAKSYEVLSFLRPDGGYVQYGDSYEGIIFEPQCEPFTKAEYEAAFDLVDTAKAQAEISNATAKAALLERLGITEEEAKLLLS